MRHVYGKLAFANMRLATVFASEDLRLAANAMPTLMVSDSLTAIDIGDVTGRRADQQCSCCVNVVNVSERVCNVNQLFVYKLLFVYV